VRGKRKQVSLLREKMCIHISVSILVCLGSESADNITPKREHVCVRVEAKLMQEHAQGKEASVEE
jgi:hypothetical protein